MPHMRQNSSTLQGCESWRDTQFWLQESTLDRFHAAVEKLTPWVTGHRGWHNTSKVRTYYLCILETIVLKAAWISAEEHVQTTGKVCFCKTSERYWGENKTFYSPGFVFFFFSTVCHKKKTCLSPTSWVFSPPSWALSLCLIWRGYGYFTNASSLHSSQRKVLLLEKWQHLLDRHTTISQTWQWQP